MGQSSSANTTTAPLVQPPLTGNGKPPNRFGGFSIFMSLISNVALSGCVAVLMYDRIKNPSATAIDRNTFLLASAVGSSLFTIVSGIDVAFGEPFWKNNAVLKKNGFSLPFTLANGLFIIWGAELVFTGLVTYNWADIVVRLDWLVPLRVVGALVATDLYFYYAHRFMHRHTPGVHLMHHCCFTPSFSSNFVFNVIDFSLEFGGALGASFLVLNTNLIGQYDPFAYFVTAAIIQWWYAMDHDPLLYFSHYRHHSLLSSQYASYAQFPTKRDEQEQLKNRIVR